MALNQIGTIEFVLLNGEIPPLQQPTEQLRRPGLPNYGKRILGTQGERFELRSMDVFATEAAATSAMDSYAALSALGEQALTRESTSWGNVVVFQAVKVLLARRALVFATRNVTPVSGVGQWVLRATWSLARVYVPPP